MAFLYCDIVTPTIFGHTSVPLIKIVPIESRSVHNLTGVFHEFQNLEYFQVESKSIQTLSFQLCTHDGNFVNFESGDVQLTLTFHKTL